MGKGAWMPPHYRPSWRCALAVWRAEYRLLFRGLWPIFGEWGIWAWQHTIAHLWPFRWARRQFAGAWAWCYGPQSGFVPHKPELEQQGDTNG